MAHRVLDSIEPPQLPPNDAIVVAPATSVPPIIATSSAPPARGIPASASSMAALSALPDAPQTDTIMTKAKSSGGSSKSGSSSGSRLAAPLMTNTAPKIEVSGHSIPATVLPAVSQLPRPGPAPTWQLRWGNRTWMLPLLISTILSMLIIAWAWRYKNGAWFGVMYVPLMGYYILFSIYQVHFYPSVPQATPEPSVKGMDRYIIIFIVTIVMWFLHNAVLSMYFKETKRLVTAHISFIITGFFCGAWEDTCWGPVQFTKWPSVKNPALFSKTLHLRGIFWYSFSWLVWFLVVVLICGLGRTNPDWILLQWYLAVTQMAIVTQLSAGLWTKPFWETVTFVHPYSKGLIMTGAWWFNATSATLIIYFIASSCWPQGKPADIWHFCTTCGSYPLAPAVCFGLYGDTFKTLFSSKTAHAIFAYFFIAGVSILDFLLFHLVYTQFGVTPAAPTWFQDVDLVTNFTIVLFLLTWYWFTQRYLLMVRVAPKLPPEEPFHDYDVELANCGNNSSEDTGSSYTTSYYSDASSIQHVEEDKQALLGQKAKRKSGHK
ncbi:hypothetical protein Pelo_7342 [Pelomyxa schiedti]|nr:hypothetical protein Pelo_7342 [Pelomyxa schiedti]